MSLLSNHSKKQPHAMAGMAAALVTFAVSAASAPLTITSPATLPGTTVGANYSFVLTATGGTPPYTWALGGNLPPGLQLDSNAGVIAGIPSQTGTFLFSLQVTDSTKASANGNFSLTVGAAALTITTVSPLFTATVGAPYSQNFTAAGGSPPYTWSITQGSIAPLTLSPGGALTGTPTSPGTLNFTVQVKDSAGAIASQAFSLTVNSPPLVITTAADLPNAALGTNYSQQLSATGGISPYSWSGTITVPGLSLSSAGVLSGSPTTTGSYSFTIQVADSGGTMASRLFSLAVQAPALTITTVSPLSGATAGIPYLQTVKAVGGVPSYTWSASGLPAGLTIDPASGTISGIPTAAGSFQVNLRVIDTARVTIGDIFSLNVALPVVPAITLSGVTAQAQPGSQIPVQIAIDNPYSGPISGQITLAFAPTIQGATDPTIQFSTGGTVPTTTTFTIAAGQTSAVYAAAASTAQSSSLALQTGTLAGTITLSVTAQAFGVDVTPQPAPTQSISVSPSVPGISQAQLTASGQTITIQIIGFSTTREVSQAVFNFGTAQGSVLQTGQFTIAVGTAFSTWYADPNSKNFGSQFLYSQSFTVQGDPTVVTLQSVTLTNQVGVATYAPH